MKEEIRALVEQEKLVVSLSGRIDSTNATEVEQKITKLQQQYPGKEIILDAEKLEYISSAGLRVVLKLRKQQNALCMRGVSAEVYDILDITGFTELLTIEKALRTISVDGCEVLGKGGNGTVYRIDGDTIVKVYGPKTQIYEVDRERDYSRKAFVSGIPTAIPYDIVTCGDCYGLVYELIDAHTLGSCFDNEPEKFEEYVNKYAGLLKNLHSAEMEEGCLHTTKELYHNWSDEMTSYLTEKEIEDLHRLIDSIPDRGCIIHGDFHPKNIMVQNGELVLIDMADITVGHPVFDLAAMYLIMVFCGSDGRDITKEIVGIPHETCVKVWRKFLEVYCETTDETRLAKIESQCAAYALLKITIAPALNKNTKKEVAEGIIAMARHRFFPRIDEMIEMLDF